MLFAVFPGRPRARLGGYLALFVTGGCFVALGTVVSTHEVAAVATMAVVGFVVLFAGVVVPQAATASTAAILTFVLPVAVAAPPSAVGARLAGWALAGLVCIPACLLVWPTPWHDELRRRLSAAVAAVGRLVESRSTGRDDEAAFESMHAELAALRQQFRATPYPPTGAATSAVALAKLVGRVDWVASNAELLCCRAPAGRPPVVPLVADAAADTLHRSAGLICDGSGHPVDDPAAIEALEASMVRLDHTVGSALEREVDFLDRSRGGASRGRRR